MNNSKPEGKLERILEAAQKRFGHYGLSKTTMNEIAADIGMSKASLYYYFKDKESIFIAVAKKEMDFFEDELNRLTGNNDRAEVMLKGYVMLRIDLLKNLLTLGKFSFGTYMEIKPVLSAQIQELREKDIKIVTIILKKGIERNEFIIKNIKLHAELFVDGLAGLRKICISGNPGNNSLFTAKEYQKLKLQSEMFADVFIKGITT